MQKKTDAQRQLLYDVSHELRAPLARLQVVAAIVEQTLPYPSEELSRIHVESENMSALVQRILDFSRLEESALHWEEIEVSELVGDVVNDLLFEYPDRSFNIISGAPSLSLTMYSDLMRHALHNILQNACKYSPVDAPIDVAVKAENMIVVIVVRDYGGGVRQAEIGNLTKAFSRGEGANKEEGFGLGLSIAKRAIEKNRGVLEIENHIDGGLVVSIKMPI